MHDKFKPFGIRFVALNVFKSYIYIHIIHCILIEDDVDDPDEMGRLNQLLV